MYFCSPCKAEKLREQKLRRLENCVHLHVKRFTSHVPVHTRTCTLYMDMDMDMDMDSGKKVKALHSTCKTWELTVLFHPSMQLA